MRKIELYTKSWCPYCSAAKQLLGEIRVDFTEYDVTDDADLEREMQQRSGRTSVPQVFINYEHIGGYDDLDARWRESGFRGRTIRR